MKKLILILMVGSLFAQNEEQANNHNKYQITASRTLESLAEDKKSERQIGGGLLTGLGLLCFIATGDSEANSILKVTGVIIGGIGILYLAIKSKAEKKYDSIQDIDNNDEKEGLAYHHLVYLSDEAKRNRQYSMAIFGALSAYSFLGQPIKEYETKYTYYGYERIETNSDLNLYNGLIYGVSAFYYYKVLSKEEKALENFKNQP